MASLSGIVATNLLHPLLAAVLDDFGDTTLQIRARKSGRGRAASSRTPGALEKSAHELARTSGSVTPVQPILNSIPATVAKRRESY